MIAETIAAQAGGLTGTALRDFLSAKLSDISKEIGSTIPSPKLILEAEKSFTKNASVRLLSNRAQFVKLLDVYVHSNVQGKQFPLSTISDSQLLNQVLKGKRAIVRGTGGAGKTFMMKYFWLQVFCDQNSILPVFVDLKKANTFSSIDQINLETISRFALTLGNDIEADLFQKLCRKGKIFVILDGFDEVNSDRRHVVENLIVDFSTKYKNMPLVLSSRDNNMLERMSGFEIFDVCKFDIKQSRKLIEKAGLDVAVSKRFLDKMDVDFFEKHKTFLEIPLLVLMFAIVFRNNANVPDETYQIYEKVFQALYEEHDSNKDGFYKRERSLGQLQLKRFLACFCIRTYFNEEYSFEKTEILEKIDATKAFISKRPALNLDITAEAEDILKDLTESLCFLYRDGDKYAFVHRSFQEFFAAYYLMQLDDSKCYDLLTEFLSRLGDSVPTFCYELNSVKTWDLFIAPISERIKPYNFPEEIKSFNQLRKFHFNGIVNLTIYPTLKMRKSRENLSLEEFENEIISSFEISSFDTIFLDWLVTVGELPKERSIWYGDEVDQSLYGFRHKIPKQNIESIVKLFADDKKNELTQMRWSPDSGFRFTKYVRLDTKRREHKVHIVENGFKPAEVSTFKKIALSVITDLAPERDSTLMKLYTKHQKILKSQKKSIDDIFG